MATPQSSTQSLGARLLREIAAEEGSLEELLTSLRTQYQPSRPRTGIPELDQLWKTHGQAERLAISGRGLPLLYHIIDHMISFLRGTVAIVDLEGRFSPSHLHCDLSHVHVFRPTRETLGVTLKSVERYMLWGHHESKGRVWVGMLVNGDTAGEIVVDWRGWLKVERKEVLEFGLGVSTEEAIGERERRQEVVDRGFWRASCGIGEMEWREEQDSCA